jgi:hypothetical protein
MAKKRRPGVGAPGQAEAVASTNDGNHSTRTQPQGQAKNAASNGAYALSYADGREPERVD